ncbi:hypothetical protein F2Q69_00025380, partial [Brassica cretica]
FLAKTSEVSLWLCLYPFGLNMATETLEETKLKTPAKDEGEALVFDISLVFSLVANCTVDWLINYQPYLTTHHPVWEESKGGFQKAQMIKKNISQFSGFVWSEEEEEKQRAKVKEKLDKCIKEKLIFFCDVLDIPINRSHIKKEEVAVKVLEFLESPKATRDVILADQEKESKMQKSTQKKRKSGEASDTPAKRKRQTKKLDHPSDKEEGKDQGDSDSEDSKDTHEEDVTAPEEEDSDHEKTETEEERDEAEDEKKPSDKKTSSKMISSDTKDSKKYAEKSSKRVAKPTSSPAKKQKVDHDDESSKGKSKKQLIKPQTKGSKEKGKASKKGKAEPTREEMLEVVTKMLKEVDFNTATLSDILQNLSDHFGVDLLHRKKICLLSRMQLVKCQM